MTPICDDCRREYEPPVYYTLQKLDDAEVAEISTSWAHADGSACTGSLCPDCAGPYLIPDNPGDPRRPEEAQLR